MASRVTKLLYKTVLKLAKDFDEVKFVLCTFVDILQLTFITNLSFLESYRKSFNTSKVSHT